MNNELIADDIKRINKLSEEEQKYLYGECDVWVNNNFESGFEIIAIMEQHNHKNGIEHCYLRNKITGCCYDVRGEFGSDDDIMRYTGINHKYNITETYVFEDLVNFKLFLKWVEFEQVKSCFLLT